MSIKPNDAAFPRVCVDGFETMGLSKREYFAAIAMQGLCASDVIQTYLKEKTRWGTSEGSEKLAVSAISLADALIEELNKE